LGEGDKMNELLKKIKFVAFDFDGVFTNNKVIVSDDGHESVICNRSDSFGLSMLRKLGIEMVIISTESNPVVKARAKKLKLECYHNCSNKIAYLNKILAQKKISLENTAFVGNDINDKVCFDEVGVPVVVNDAYPQVKKLAKIILTKDGGEGAVREFCEMIYKAKKEIK
jgi:YrbI family 3-deoxy-D-manno-octulosonate 8-phosphate phosphatase